VRPAPHTSRASARGSTAAEFAVILPLAVVVMFGSIEAGRMVACRQMLTYATMEGVRTAAALGTPDVGTVQTAVLGAAPMLALTLGNVTVTAYNTSCAAIVPPAVLPAPIVFTSRAPGQCARVRVDYTFTPALSGSWGSWLVNRVWTETQTMTVF
jgi:Flp pilus assembly protein TadG